MPLGPIDDEPLVLPSPPNPDFYDPGWDEWRQPRRWPVVVVGLAVLFGLVGLGAYKIIHSGSTAPQVYIPKSLAPTTYTIGSGPESPPPVYYSGDKNLTTTPFTSAGGMVVISASSTTPWQFGVTLLNSTGDLVAVPYNVVGNVHGNIALHLPAGSYRLQVVASAHWELAVTQPTNVTPMGIPSAHVGVGYSVIGPYPSGTSIKLIFGFLGEATTPPASVRMLNLDGTPASGGGLLVSETSQKIDQIVLPPTAQPFYLQIFAPWYWQLRLNPAN